MSDIKVPFFRPELTEEEVTAVADVLRSGWLTSGPQVRSFEKEFAAAVGARHAVAVNSCTAALHLAVDALGLKPGQGVLVPTMTFAATAEVIRYLGATPVLVDCDENLTHADLASATQRLADAEASRLPAGIPSEISMVGVIPVHVGGVMMDVSEVQAFANRHQLWVVEDAAHAFPAAWRRGPLEPWQCCGEGTAAVTCFSFYANKTITTGEGGMATTNDGKLAQRMRLMSLHGLSRDAWNRYSGGGWDYKIIAPGYKYNLTDMAAALGMQQLGRAEEFRKARARISRRYRTAWANVEEIELPPNVANRRHAWHLFPIRLRLERLEIDRNAFIEELNRRGVSCSVHWRPLHLHPYYQESFGWRAEHCPVATAVWQRLVSLPIFPSMREEEVGHVIRMVIALCAAHRRRARRAVPV